ncbi:hypothetical protein AAFN86_15750 [Roseomonas sp. CAU 1739]|uniref:hypothetical protein n=1 Tax=Roseomonas sp. CAU 1739 TaxID=3140364 RepID=UPI00325AB385
MPTDLVLRAISTAEPVRAAARAAGQAMAAETVPAVAAPATPNPRLRLDGSLGMVVLEFRGAAGEVANTIPSPRAIAAYRAAAISDAPVPFGVAPRAEPAPAPTHDVAVD